MSDDLPSEENTWRRRLGSDANDRAWTLAEQKGRTPDEDLEMLHAAHAAAHLWSTIGTERNAALANLLLGQVHALLGSAELASRFAQTSLDFFLRLSSESATWELALAHAIAAHAAHVRGDKPAHEKEYAESLLAFESITDAEERKIVRATLRVIPMPEIETR
jgi:hypothetical protein